LTLVGILKGDEAATAQQWMGWSNGRFQHAELISRRLDRLAQPLHGELNILRLQISVPPPALGLL